MNSPTNVLQMSQHRHIHLPAKWQCPLCKRDETGKLKFITHLRHHSQTRLQDRVQDISPGSAMDVSQLQPREAFLTEFGKQFYAHPDRYAPSKFVDGSATLPPDVLLQPVSEDTSSYNKQPQSTTTKDPPESLPMPKSLTQAQTEESTAVLSVKALVLHAGVLALLQFPGGRSTMNPILEWVEKHCPGVKERTRGLKTTWQVGLVYVESTSDMFADTPAKGDQEVPSH